MSQQISLNGQQMIQITDKVLQDLVLWMKQKREDPQCHAHKDDQALKSLIHSRLLLQLRYRELLMTQAKQIPQPKQIPVGSASRVRGAEAPLVVTSLEGYIDAKRL